MGSKCGKKASGQHSRAECEQLRKHAIERADAVDKAAAEKKLPTDKLTLVLNRPALERLVCGDTEVEVKLREQAVKQILDKFLRQALKTEAIKEVRASIVKEVSEIADSVFEIGPGGGFRRYGMPEEMKRRIHAAVKGECDRLVEDAIGKALENITPTIEAHVARVTEARVKDKVRVRVNEVIQRMS